MFDVMRIIRYLNICWVFLILGAESLQAYDHVPTGTENQFFLQERYRGPSHEGEKWAITFYDNLNGLSGRESQAVVVDQASDQFVSFHKISFNFPLHITVYRQKSIDVTITDLVYANLKLKKVFDEYVASQQRVLEVLEGLSVPFLDYQFSFLEQRESGLFTYTGNEALSRTSRNVMRKGAFSGGMGSLSLNSPGRRLGITDDDFFNNSSRPIGEFERFTNRSRPRSQGLGRSGRSSESKTSSPEEERVPLDGQGSSSLPWILRAPLSSWKYIMENKVEGGIYVIILYLLVAGITSRKRGKKG